jgi:hypothetical protein
MGGVVTIVIIVAIVVRMVVMLGLQPEPWLVHPYPACRFALHRAVLFLAFSE